MKKLFAVIALLFTINQVVGWGTEDIYFDDGQYHLINHSAYGMDILHLDENIANNPGTHFEIVDGAGINFVYFYNNATVDMSGGNIHGSLDMYDDTEFNMSSGDIRFQLFSCGNSSIRISGGEIGGNLFIDDNSAVSMTGGVIGESYFGYNNSTASISNGTIGKDIHVMYNSTVTLSGGYLGGYLITSNDATIYLVGTDFEVTNLDGVTTALSYGDKLSDYVSFAGAHGNDYRSGTIKGTLADGSTLDNKFRIFNADPLVTSCNIIIIPEPATVLLLAVGGLALRRRKR